MPEVDQADLGLLHALLARKEELERERARIEREMRAIEDRVGELKIIGTDFDGC